MNNEYILEITRLFKNVISTPSKKSSMDTVPMSMPGVLGHLSWMCNQIPVLLEEGKNSRVQRWLGFIQGATWVLGIKTIDIDKMNSDRKVSQNKIKSLSMTHDY
jgi:hypothetical protein